MPKGIQLRRGRPGVRVDTDAYLLDHHVFAASLGPSLFLHSLVGDKHALKKTTASNPGKIAVMLTAMKRCTVL